MSVITSTPASGTAPRAVRAGPASRTATVLTGALIALMAVESALGLLLDGLYPEDTWAVAAFRGNDLVTLVVVVPVTALALRAVVRHPTPSAVAVWLGTLFYGVYNFAYYAFGARFNDVFLLHVVSFTTSVAALVLAASCVDLSVVPSGAAVPRAARPVAAFLVLVGAALALAWGGFSVRFAVTGRLPDDVMPAEAVHLVYALDLSLLAPAFLVSGVLLWRRTSWGFLLGGAVSVFGAAYLTVLWCVGGFQADAGITGKTWLSPTGVIPALLCLACALLLLRRRDHRPPDTEPRT